MAAIERRLCIAGLMLFLLALLQGFFIPLFERIDAARAAHATALGSGTFLIAVGLLWSRLSFGHSASRRWAVVLAMSLYAICVGLTLSASYPAATEAAHRVASVSSLTLNIVGAAALIASLTAVIVAFKPVPSAYSQ